MNNIMVADYPVNWKRLGSLKPPSYEEMQKKGAEVSKDRVFIYGDSLVSADFEALKELFVLIVASGYFVKAYIRVVATVGAFCVGMEAIGLSILISDEDYMLQLGIGYGSPDPHLIREAEFSEAMVA